MEQNLAIDGHPLPPRPRTRHIPNEIIENIVQFLELPVNGVGEITPGSPERFLEIRRTLYSLCLTTRFSRLCARKLLYQTVIFFFGSDPDDDRLGRRFGNARNLMLLIRSLLEGELKLPSLQDDQPKITDLIKNVIMPTDLTGWHWSKIGDNNEDCPFKALDYPP
ncbi:hypothetical protein F4819DRAFT_115552 [Hypoxylon fuscum]|nr:hypothetical protein F4819DRAFT_115552 [Hypoxylon fuscum]